MQCLIDLDDRADVLLLLWTSFSDHETRAQGAAKHAIRLGRQSVLVVQPYNASNTPLTDDKDR